MLKPPFCNTNLNLATRKKEDMVFFCFLIILPASGLGCALALWKRTLQSPWARNEDDCKGLWPIFSDNEKRFVGVKQICLRIFSKPISDFFYYYYLASDI